MAEWAVVFLAVATATGAWWARPIPIVVGILFAGGALLGRRWWLAVLAGFLLASALSAQAWVGVAPASDRPVAEVVTLLTDPAPLGSGERATVKLGGKHVEITAHGGAAKKLARLLAGDRVRLDGQLKPVAGSPGLRLAHRHIVGRIEVTSVGDQQDGAPVFRSANRVRRMIERGARVMSPAEQALFSGFVLGDDRAEPAEVVDEFRASGLSHLTAVSGENVAFVLVAASPLLRRLTIRWRWAATVGLVAWFAMLTRFEPSVLRASAMATVAVTAWALARPSSTIRMLGLATTAMMLLDPFLVYSAGWWLSVGATFGIAFLAGRIAERLPGPRSLALAVGVTLAAQIGVAPVQLAIFGGMPVVSLPANLLAVPAAGPVMIWGLPAGLVAGFLPSWAAMVLHFPSRVCIRWIALVARVAAALPLGTLQTRHVLVAAGAVGIAWVWRRQRIGHLAGLSLAAVVLISAIATANAAGPSGPSRLTDTVRVWHVGAATVVAVDGRAPRLLDVLRKAKINRVDALIATSNAADLESAGRLYQPVLMLTADTPPGSYRAGKVRIDVVAFGDTIDVEVGAIGRADSG
jgi:competence protein ComEC